MLHHNWVKTTGRVLDSRIRKVYHDRADDGTLGSSIPLHNYIVEPYSSPSLVLACGRGRLAEAGWIAERG